ncbi:dethiobiotin synthase [Halosquirtibacter xylanolyticus]|uniref:dethiobiotin synthase n=1 Tax=Halosquirtibacter xylanolyticus TaxID=3374599 RepID=UPI003749221B|nr:dethiobiotin synthase [Prolixibacteraceae bacterium]
MKKTYFISGIDTDCGKTIATGIMAKSLHHYGHKVITQKFIQTGNIGYSEDIEKHRELMGVNLFQEDFDHTTAPLVYSTPVSPHLAAEIDVKEVDIQKVYDATQTLEKRFDHILLEGAGGLMVPYSRSQTTLDYLKASALPLILVTSSKLGSINHTLLSLEVIKKYDIPLHGVVYNHLPHVENFQAVDTVNIIKTYLSENFQGVLFTEIPNIEDHKNYTIPEPVIEQWFKQERIIS